MNLFTKAALVLVSFSSTMALASSPKVSSQELYGNYPGQSSNGPCMVSMGRANNIMVIGMTQNMTVTQGLPLLVNSMVKKLNSSGEYQLSDNAQVGAGYDNSVSLKLRASSVAKAERCLDISISDVSNQAWVTSNSCSINLNRSGKNCSL